LYVLPGYDMNLPYDMSADLDALDTAVQ